MLLLLLRSKLALYDMKLLNCTLGIHHNRTAAVLYHLTSILWRKINRKLEFCTLCILACWYKKVWVDWVEYYQNQEKYYLSEARYWLQFVRILEWKIMLILLFCFDYTIFPYFLRHYYYILEYFQWNIY